MSRQQFTNYYTRSFEVVQGKTATLRQNLTTRRINLPLKKNYLIVLGVLVILVLGILLAKAIFFRGSSSDVRTTAPSPIATQELNKKFEFPLKDDKNKTVANISYLIESANIQDSFIYQGKLATAVQGRTFLIFNLKITNPYTKTIEVNAKDYVRIKVNGSSEQLAPEIHNDPVQIQAKSTKYTRIGLPINDTDKNIVLLIGELQGKKEVVALDLKR